MLPGSMAKIIKRISKESGFVVRERYLHLSGAS